MTTIYSSKSSALKAGIYYSRGEIDIKVEDLKKLEGLDIKDCDFLGVHTRGKVEVFELENSNGKTVRIAVGTCDDGFELWLVTDNGFALRT